MLVPSEEKMRLAAGNINLDCERIKKKELLNPRTEDSTQGWELLQFQADQKVEWHKCTFQELVNLAAVEYIVVDVYTKYVEELKEDYVGYKK